MNELILYTTEDGRSQIKHGKLDPAATIKESLTVQTGGAREVRRSARGQAPLEYDQKHSRPCHG